MLQSMGSQRVGHDLETEQSDKGIFKEGLNGHLKVGFSKQEYWIGLPFPSPGDLPDRGIEARSHTLQGDVKEMTL